MTQHLVMHKKHHDKEIFAKVVAHTLCELSEEAQPSDIIFSKKALIDKHKDNIVVKNSLKYLISNVTDKNRHRQLLDNKEKLFSLFHEHKQKIHEHIKHKTILNKTIYVHGINEHLTYSLSKLKKDKTIKIIAPMLYPLYKGKPYLGEDIKYVDDIDIYNAVSRSNIILIGADKVSKDYTICKKGTKLCVEIAKKYHKPTYLCASSFYLDAHDSISDSEYTKHNEKIENKEVSGIISEIGIHPAHHFFLETLHYNPWLKNKDF